MASDFSVEDEQFGQFEGGKRVVEELQRLVFQQLRDGIVICQIREMGLDVGAAFFEAAFMQVL